MFRILRAFAWLRWRILMNSLERGGARDALQRFSLALEQLAPAIVLLLLAPSAVALAGAGGYAGWSLATSPGGSVAFELLRLALLAAVAVALVAPLLLPAGDRTNAVRLLLLPIPRRVLYLGQVVSALADPWVVLVAAVLAGCPFGLLVAGRPGAAALAAAAGVLLLLTLLGLGLLMTGAAHLVLRNRRRGELIALLMMLLISLLGFLPGLMNAADRQERVRVAPSARQHPGWWRAVERGVTIVPSEIYASAVRRAAGPDAGGAAVPLLALAAVATLAHGGAAAAFLRVLGAPGLLAPGRRVGRTPRPAWRLPGVSPSVSAVAINQLRLAARTPRGRLTFLSPLMVFVMFAALMWQSPSGMELGFITVRSGPGLAAFSSAIALLALLPLAMNQFAIDGAGLTLALLTPLETGALLYGKALGNALVAAVPAGVCLTAAALLYPSGDPAFWACVPLATLATYVLVAPLAAILSAVFPRAVDLNSISKGSNAHGAAGLLGTLAFAAAGTPPLLLVLLAAGAGRPALAPLFLVGWIVLAAAVSAVLFHAAAAVFERRKETIVALA